MGLRRLLRRKGRKVGTVTVEAFVTRADGTKEHVVLARDEVHMTPATLGALDALAKETPNG